MSSSVSVDDAAGFVLEQVGTAVGAVAVGFAMTGVCVAVTCCSRIFFAAFCQMSSMAVRGSDDKYEWTETLDADNKCWVSVLGSLDLVGWVQGAVTWMKCAGKLCQ